MSRPKKLPAEKFQQRTIYLRPAVFKKLEIVKNLTKESFQNLANDAIEESLNRRSFEFLEKKEEKGAINEG